MKKMPGVEGFWARVQKTSACWNWVGAIDREGYGRSYLGGNGRVRGAHRVSWELAFGPVPDGLCVCHHCDNRRCVRPDHLFVGTQKDNSDDRDAKGRANTNRLTPEQVREIRRLYRKGVQGFGQPALGKRFGVSAGTIQHIVEGKTWGSLL